MLGILLLPMFSGCNSQQTRTEKEEMDDLWKRELANQENAKTGNKNPVIEIITDPGKVEQLRKEISKKIKARETARLKEAGNKTLDQRYKQNDKSVIPEILSTLRGNNVKKKSEVYDDLGKDYDTPETYKITEPELIEELLKGIEDPAEEEDAVQLAGFNKLPGYHERFEKRLLSGKSKNEGRIFYWLGDEATSMQALNYAETGIKARRFTEKELDQIIQGLENFGAKGNVEMKRKVGELALFIYQNKLIEDKRIEDLKNSAFTSDAAESLLLCLFNYGDERVIPVAHEILNKKIRIAGPVNALIRLEGEKHMDKVHALLKNEDKFYDGLTIIESLDRKLISRDMLEEILVQFARQEHINNHGIERIIDLFRSLNAENYIRDADKIIADKELAGRIKKEYELSKTSLDEVLKELLNLGLIRNAPDTLSISKIKKESNGDPLSFIYGILDKENIYHSFDAETGFVPADYDELVLEFASKSKGILSDILVWMDVKENRDGETFQYIITVISNNKVFIAKPEDMGDWYDIMAVNALLDKLFEDLKSKEKFVSIETGDQTVQYIFGDPEKINLLVKKFRLTNHEGL